MRILRCFFACMMIGSIYGGKLKPGHAVQIDAASPHYLQICMLCGLRYNAQVPHRCSDSQDCFAVMQKLWSKVKKRRGKQRCWPIFSGGEWMTNNVVRNALSLVVEELGRQKKVAQSFDSSHTCLHWRYLPHEKAAKSWAAACAPAPALNDSAMQACALPAFQDLFADGKCNTAMRATRTLPTFQEFCASAGVGELGSYSGPA